MKEKKSPFAPFLTTRPLHRKQNFILVWPDISFTIRHREMKGLRRQGKCMEFEINNKKSVGTVNSLTVIGRVRKIAVEKKQA